MNTKDCEDFQDNYEQRFGCCICLGPKLNMVSGRCQHRICDDCLYIDKLLRPCMEKCPVCGMQDSFPIERPIIPAQVKEVQRIIGVQECPNGCRAEMWYWEVEEHNSHCSKYCEEVPAEKPNTKRSRRSHVADRGQVSVISRVRSGRSNQSKTVAKRIVTRSFKKTLRSQNSRQNNSDS